MKTFVNVNVKTKTKWKIAKIPKNGTMTHAHVDAKMPKIQITARHLKCNFCIKLFKKLI
jgi:hypothetical protein